MNNIRLLLFPIAAALALSACGNKGPLVLPDKPAESATPADEGTPTSQPPPPANSDETKKPETPPEPLPLDNDD